MSFVPTRSAVALAALAAVLVAAPEAGAKKPPLNPSTLIAPVIDPILHPAPDACGYVGTRVFAAWHDRLGYVLTPDGGFENGGAGWALTRGAAPAEGNEIFQVAGATDHRALALPAGSQATSAPICVAKHDGIFRLFTKSSGNSHARLKVDVRYANGRRGKTSVLGAHDVWTPTRSLAVAIGRAKKGRESTATIAFRFTPLSGDWQIDDVYLDPRLRH
jgi:hypothetical protein